MHKDAEGKFILDAEESVLEAFCRAHRTCFPDIEARIEALPEGHNKQIVLRHRASWVRAWCETRNQDAAEGFYYAMVEALQSVEVLMPKVRKASRAGTTRSDAAMDLAKAAPWYQQAYEQLFPCYKRVGADRLAGIAAQLAAGRKEPKELQDLLRSSARAQRWLNDQKSTKN